MSEAKSECHCLTLGPKPQYDEIGLLINNCRVTLEGEICSFCENVFTEHNPWSGHCTEEVCSCTDKMHMKCVLMYLNITIGVRKKHFGAKQPCRSCIKCITGARAKLNTEYDFKIQLGSNWHYWTPYYHGSETLNYDITFYHKASGRATNGIKETWYFPYDDRLITKPSIMMKANMTNSQYNGQYIEYSRPGFPNPRKISHFKNGRNHGNQITFYENLAKVPLIKSNVQYIEGRLHGVDQEYQIYTNHANKVNSKSEVYLSKESYYSEGYLDGFSRRWGLNIVKNQTYLLEEIKFKRGNYDLSIPIKKWYNEKQLSTEITYIGSETIKPFGKCDVVYSKEWHPNGKIKFEGRQRIINNGNLSVFDPLDFPSIIYNADGSINTRKTKIPNPTFNEVTDDPEEAELIQIEEFFVNNIKSYCYTKIYHKHHNRYMNHGIYMSWFKNGCIYEIINFYKGNKIGNYVKYDSEGRIRKLGVYDIYDGEFRYT